LYRIADLDGTELCSSYPRNKLTKFYQQSLSDPLTQLEDKLPEFVDEPNKVIGHRRLADEPDKASAEGEELYLTFRRRLTRILKGYGQDLLPRR
jgi:hypothetical protein